MERERKNLEMDPTMKETLSMTRNKGRGPLSELTELSMSVISLIINLTESL